MPPIKKATTTTTKPAAKQPTGTRALRHATAQRLFLEQFSKSGNITRACQAAGINRMTAHRWLEHDQVFAIGFHEAELAATEYLEGVAWDRATHAEQPSDRLLEFLLRARAPAKYGTQRTETTTQGALTITYVNDWRSASVD